MTRLNRSPHGDEAEIDIYLNFVDSLFADRRSMLMGVTLQIGIAVCVYIESGMTSMGLWPGIFLLTAAYRYFHIVRYGRQLTAAESMDRDTRLAWAKDWERR